MTKIKKENVEKYSKLAVKKGTEAGKTVIRTKLIVIGIILLVITVGIVVIIQAVPWMLIIDDGGGGGGGDYYPDDPIIIDDPLVIEDPVEHTPPAAPVLNLIIPNPNTNGDIYLSWTRVEDNERYYIYKYKDGRYIGLASTARTSFWIKELESGKYRFVVKARNEYGSSPSSNAQFVQVIIFAIPDPIPDPIITPPATPVLDQFIPNVDIDGVVKLTWTAISNADSYKIYRSKDGGTYEIVTTVSTNSYTDNGLEDGIYIYKIKAINNAGDSNVSNIQAVKVQTSASPPPEPPTSETDQTIVLIVLVVVVILGISMVIIIRKFSRKTKRKIRTN